MLRNLKEQLQKNATWRNKLNKMLDFFLKHQVGLLCNFMSHFKRSDVSNIGPQAAYSSTCIKTQPSFLGTLTH